MAGEMRFIDFIRDRARYYNCPHCGRSLRDCELRVVRHVQDRYTIQVTCAACHVQFLLMLAIQGDGLESLPSEEPALAEDASLASPARVGHPEPEPIGSDELLDVHLALRDFDGRLTDLFKQPSPERT